MASVNDWAAKAAQRIRDEYANEFNHRRRMYHPTEERIAAIIATFAEPLMRALRDSRREHNTSCCAYSNYQPPYEECTCGADAWNARIEAVLGGEAPAP